MQYMKNVNFAVYDSYWMMYNSGENFQYTVRVHFQLSKSFKKHAAPNINVK